jgi:hypothetical protein
MNERDLEVERILERMWDSAVEELDRYRERKGLQPSQIQRAIEIGGDDGLSEYWREWWEMGDEEWS